MTAKTDINLISLSDRKVKYGLLPLMESFYSIQGEGVHTGKAAFFIRLAGCDVGCVWCDVKESWTVHDDQWKEVGELVREAKQHPAAIVVITGGEPCFYDLTELITALQSAGLRVHIETSGAYPLSGNPDWVCLSPKKFKQPLESMLSRADELKVVIAHPSDFEWAENNASMVRGNCRLLLQPEYEKSARFLPLISQYVLKHPRWSISLQTHKILGVR
jgi:7-carboxy-7-deazaguanine synthase